MKMKASVESRHPELTLDEFAALPPEDGYRLELSRGRLVREPAPGPRHGHVAGRIYRLLWPLGEGEGRGRVFFDTAFVLSTQPPSVRVPDVAFVAAQRVPEEGLADRPWELAPDLVVEVLSPSNSASDMQAKALQYLDAGAGVVWVVDPRGETVTEYRSRREIRILEGDDLLEGGEVLPGLEVRVGGLFE